MWGHLSLWGSDRSTSLRQRTGVKRRFRLTRSGDFQRVRRLGKSYAHPLMVLVALRREEGPARVAVSAGRSLGGAVERNRAKRRLRSAIQPYLSFLRPGWDMVLIARRPLLQAPFTEVQAALRTLLGRAHLWQEDDDTGSSTPLS